MLNTDIIANQPIQGIAGNLSTHKAAHGKGFFDALRNGHLHFTPTHLIRAQPGRTMVRQRRAQCHSSRRNYLSSRSEKTSIRYIRQYNKSSKTVKAKYFDFMHRITCKTIGAFSH